MLYSILPINLKCILKTELCFYLNDFNLKYGILYCDVNLTINKDKFIIFGPSAYFTLTLKSHLKNGFEVYSLINSNSISYRLI